MYDTAIIFRKHHKKYLRDACANGDDACKRLHVPAVKSICQHRMISYGAPGTWTVLPLIIVTAVASPFTLHTPHWRWATHLHSHKSFHMNVLWCYRFFRACAYLLTRVKCIFTHMRVLDIWDSRRLSDCKYGGISSKHQEWLCLFSPWMECWCH